MTVKRRAGMALVEREMGELFELYNGDICFRLNLPEIESMLDLNIEETMDNSDYVPVILLCREPSDSEDHEWEIGMVMNVLYSDITYDVTTIDLEKLPKYYFQEMAKRGDE